MSASPKDYLVASAVGLMRGADNSNLGTVEDLKNAVEAEYSINLDDARLNYLAILMERHGFIKITNDAYAGDYITALTGWGVTSRLNRIKESNPDHGLLYALAHGNKLLERAFSNDQFWIDLDEEILALPEEDGLEDAAEDDSVPTADGFVSLSHNQFKAIDEPTGELLEELEKDNGIPDQPGLKERIVGQIRAGRELVRAAVFDTQLFYMSMVVGLKMLIDRYKEHAIGAAASKLLDIIYENIGDVLP